MTGRRVPVGGPGAAVILAGGSGRRLGGVDKPALREGERSLLDIALDAVAGARVVVVGPDRDLPAGVLHTREEPAGAGPAAAAAAGVIALNPAAEELVAVLAADLTGVTAELLARLAAAVPPGPASGVVALDPSGRRQYLLGVWTGDGLLARSTAQDWTGGRLGDLLDPLVTAEVDVTPAEAEDIDTPEDLAAWRRGRPV